MYGTVARIKIKEGTLDELMAIGREFEEANVPGFLSETVYQMDDDPNVIFMAVAFENKEVYFANANSPEQEKFYERISALFDGEPEWNDGEVIYTYPRN